jgi:hypothetical protein
MGTDPTSGDNRWLREAMERPIPVIYFLGVSPGRYQPIIPTFIVGWHPERLRVQLAFGVIVGTSAQATLPASPERRYALAKEIPGGKRFCRLGNPIGGSLPPLSPYSSSNPGRRGGIISS